jgi:hypothetical protein
MGMFRKRRVRGGGLIEMGGVSYYEQFTANFYI